MVNPRWFQLAILVAVFLMSGCAGFRVVDQPWLSRSTSSEFDSKTVLKAGDRIRITTSDRIVSEGIFVSLDDISVTYVDTASAAEIASVSVDQIERFEVYSSGGIGTFAKVATITGASLIVYAIVDSHSEPLYDPDGADTAKLVGGR
jgi:hypothetical protein